MASGTGKKENRPPTRAGTGFVFKKSTYTPNSTTQMEGGHSEGICLLANKNPGGSSVQLEDKPRWHVTTAVAIRLIFEHLSLIIKHVVLSCFTFDVVADSACRSEVPSADSGEYRSRTVRLVPK